MHPAAQRHNMAENFGGRKRAWKTSRLGESHKEVQRRLTFVFFGFKEMATLQNQVQTFLAKATL